MFPGGHFASFEDGGEMSPYLAALMGVGDPPLAEVPEPYVFETQGLDIGDLGPVDFTQGATDAGKGIGALIDAYLHRKKKPEQPELTETEQTVAEGVQGIRQGASIGAAAGPVGILAGGLTGAAGWIADYYRNRNRNQTGLDDGSTL